MSRPRKPSPQKQGSNKGRVPPEATRFKPGQSGNPGGRPKGRTLMATIRDLLYERGDGSELAGIAQNYIEKMKGGSFPHLKEFIDRESGKVPDRVANADGSNLSGTDFSKLTTDELTLYHALLIKAKTRGSDA